MEEAVSVAPPDKSLWRRIVNFPLVTMLLAHGILHLIGYDHRTDAEEREMTTKTGELTVAAARRAGALSPSR